MEPQDCKVPNQGLDKALGCEGQQYLMPGADKNPYEVLTKVSEVSLGNPLDSEWDECLPYLTKERMLEESKSLSREKQVTKKVMNKPAATSDSPYLTKKDNCNNNNRRNNEENTTNQVINPRKRNQKLSFLQVIYTNADSLMNKRNELIERVNSEKPHVAVITEVNPKNQRYATTKQELALDGYSLFTNIDENGVRGVAIFVKNHLNTVESRKIKTSGMCEAVAVEIKLRGGDKQLILAVYRSPGSTVENNNKLNEMIRGLNHSGYSHILLLGDFNFPEV